MFRNNCFLIFLLGAGTACCAQPAENAAGLSFHLGSFITKMSKSEIVKDSYSSLLQAEWSHLTPFSSRTRLGVIGLHGNSGGRQYLGTATALMGFGDRTLIGHGHYRLHARLAAGLGWISKPYDPVTNHKNTLLGSHLNAAVQASVYQEVRIGAHVSWNTGFSFLHLSNGLSTLPNLGLNIPAFNTWLNYRWAQRPFTPRTTDETGTSRYYWQAWASAGLKQWPLVSSPRRLVSVLGLEWQKRLANGSRWGAALHAFRDPSPISPSDTVSKAPGAGGWEAGLAAQYTARIGRVEVPLQAGVYLFNQRDGNVVYQSLGVRYRFSRRWLAGVHLKTHMGKADYFHAGIGYQW
jgi:hypothetical protein